MVLFGAASGGGVVVAVALLAIGALVQVIGELLQSSGSFLLGFDLPADHAQGQYQGVWNTSTSISTMVAPTVLALLPLGFNPQRDGSNRGGLVRICAAAGFAVGDLGFEADGLGVGSAAAGQAVEQ